MNQHLLFFYGTDCSHCKKMEALVEKLETEDGIAINKLETWHNDDNVKIMESLDKEPCGGVPFFVNTQTGKTICGEVSYKKLKEWAEGK
jgi:predicted class III extradiol MEMO1 family dioxygenase